MRDVTIAEIAEMRRLATELAERVDGAISNIAAVMRDTNPDYLPAASGYAQQAQQLATELAKALAPYAEVTE